jgi:hypothetical protein
MAVQDKIKRLLFSSEPEPDESFMGYLLRLTEKNRGETPSWLASKARINSYVRAPLNFVFNNSLDFSTLAALTEASEDALKALPYHPADGVRRKMGEYLFFGRPVYQYMIRLRRPKICLECLRVFRYVKKVWEFALVTACPLHKCLLLDACPECKKPISWIRRRMSVCRCGFDWRKSRSVPVPDTECEVTRQVHSLCGLSGGDDSRRDAKIADSPLYRLGLQPFASALIFVTSQLTEAALKKGQRIVDTKGKYFARSHTNAEVHALLCRALTVFEDWPENYYSLLDMRRAERSADGLAAGRRNYFREYKSALFVQLAGSDFDFIRNTFREYRRIRRYKMYTVSAAETAESAEKGVKDTARHAVRGRRLVRIHGPAEKGVKDTARQASANHTHIPISGRPNDKAADLYATHVSGNKAIRALRTTWQGLEGLIRAGRLKAVIGSRGDDRIFFIEKKSLENLKAKLERSLFLKQVESILGVQFGRIKELVNCGLLKPLRGPDVDGCADWRVDKEEVTSLLDLLVGKLPRRRKVDKREVVDFKFVLKSTARAGVSLGVLLQAILDGEIKPVGRGKGAGLRCLLFSEKQIARYVRSEFRLLVGDAMTLSEVAESLGVTSGAVDFLAAKGFLRAEKRENAPLLGRLVTREDFDAFNESYLQASKIASEHHSSSNHVISSLAARGVRPVTGRKIDGGLIYLFRKSDLAPLDIAALMAAARKTGVIRLEESSAKTALRPEGSGPAKDSKTARHYYTSPSLPLSEAQAAEILGLDVNTVRRLAEGGALKPHKRLPPERGGGKYYFSCYIVEKYKNRQADHTGMVVFANAAKMLDLWPDNFYNKYVRTGRLKPVLEEGRRGDHYFRLEDVKALIEIERRTIITPETAEILGVNPSCVDKMIANGELRPISGPKVDGFGKNLFLRDDIEKLHKERKAYKAWRVKESKTSRFGRGPRRPRPTVPEIISPRIAQLIVRWKRQDSHLLISGGELHRQLVGEGYKVGIASVYVALRAIRQQTA